MSAAYFPCIQSVQVRLEAMAYSSIGNYGRSNNNKRCCLVVTSTKKLNNHHLESKVETLLESVKWDAKGLAGAIAQNVDTGAILMQGLVNMGALATTISSWKSTFYNQHCGRKARALRISSMCQTSVTFHLTGGNKLALTTLYSLESTISERKAVSAAPQDGNLMD